jgi:hypothetical protein
VELGIGKLSGRIAVCVGDDFDGEHWEPFCTSVDVRAWRQGSRYNSDSPLTGLVTVTG